MTNAGTVARMECLHAQVDGPGFWTQGFATDRKHMMGIIYYSGACIHEKVHEFQDEDYGTPCGASQQRCRRCSTCRQRVCSGCTPAGPLGHGTTVSQSAGQGIEHSEVMRHSQGVLRAV